MNILIYLCFTIFSITIQFIIMDILGIGKVQAMDDEDNQLTSSSTKYSNSTLHAVSYETSTKPVTILDVFYDTNITTTTEATTMEEMYFNSTTEYFNATDFSIFPNSSIFSTEKPGTIGARNMTQSPICCCNLLYNICDINCCCDEDCRIEEKMLFHCIESDIHSQNSHSCYTKVLNQTSQKSFLNHLLCAIKTNVPKKRNIVKYSEDMDTNVENIIHKSLIWQHVSKEKQTFQFNAQSYAYNDPIWFIQNETISVIDVPIPEVNYYCSGRSPILYLRDLHYKCFTKVQDLEMFNIYQKLHSPSYIISVIDKDDAKVKKNCSSLHCTSWNTIVCDKLCHSYNETLDEPTCTEQICMNMVVKIEYIFYCNNSQITNGTVYLYKRAIPLKTILVEQEIIVKFYLIRDNQKNVVKFSGSPGYLYGLPVITSFQESNFTHHFFHTNSELENQIIYPANIQGYCSLTNVTYKVVKFGNNVQSKCRLLLQSAYLSSRNATENCQSIQKTIYDLLKVNKPIYISPLGNPTKVKDNEWIEIQYDVEKGFIYGELKDNLKLKCYNMVTSLQYVFAYAYSGEESEQKILNTRAFFQMQDLSTFIEDLSMVLTIETAFIDITKPPVYEYAKGLGLDIHLPEDFFLPFASNAAHSNTVILFIIVYCAYLLII